MKWTYIAIALDSSLGALSLLWRKPRAISAIQLGVAVSAAQVYLIALALLPGGNFTASLGWYGAVVAATCLSLVAPHWLRRPLVIASFAALTLCALVAPAPAPNFGWSPAFFFTKIILLVWLEVHLFQQSK